MLRKKKLTAHVHVQTRTRWLTSCSFEHKACRQMYIFCRIVDKIYIYIQLSNSFTMHFYILDVKLGLIVQTSLSTDQNRCSGTLQATS